MAKCLLKQSKQSQWNIDCGDIEYFYWSACEYPIGCGFSAGVATALTSKYQKKLIKVTQLVNIITLAVAVFETSISKALNNGEIA